ncbi:hypothetical protein [Bizionia argentinensis]|uniref:hypothetical protein n=1 Tax=Bizionia argentinensis TaxID=456455 RepID=UPI0002230FAD|nr:hypothetical protein [Bizionia argentinensis]
MLDTSNPNSYEYTTKNLEIQILGGIKANKLESLRVTISIQKPKEHNILRHNIDLYNDNQIEKFTRKIAERLEIGTSVARITLQELTKELENYRFLLIEQYEKQHQPYFKELTGTELRVAETFLKKPNILQRTNELIGKSGVIGEEHNRQTMFLIFTSRKTNNPLHCVSIGG